MSSTAKKKKILIVVSSLGNGGAERSSALLSFLLSNLGFEVHVATVLNKIEFQYAGTLFNLGELKDRNDTILGRINRLIVFRNYLKKHQFDWIIDNRTRMSTFREIIISKFIYSSFRVIYMVRSFNIQWYFPANKYIATSIYKKAAYIIGVSKEIKEEIQKTHRYTNVISIYNPIDFEGIIHSSKEKNTEETQFILAFGRIDDEVKNYSLLMEAYSESILPQKGILLYIMGEGKDLAKLKKKALSLKYSDKILFKQKEINPFPYVKSTLFTVLTSKFEGFPRMIIESLALGIPVVSVDCKSGPKEIITNGFNGLLVENNNVSALTEAMNRMVTDEDLYKHCQKNAQISIEHLSLGSISLQWQKILEN